MARDGHRCGYCANAATTVDHILPRSRGGTTDFHSCADSGVPSGHRWRTRTKTGRAQR